MLCRGLQGGREGQGSGCEPGGPAPHKHAPAFILWDLWWLPNQACSNWPGITAGSGVTTRPVISVTR